MWVLDKVVDLTNCTVGEVDKVVDLTNCTVQGYIYTDMNVVRVVQGLNHFIQGHLPWQSFMKTSRTRQLTLLITNYNNKQLFWIRRIYPTQADRCGLKFICLFSKLISTLFGFGVYLSRPAGLKWRSKDSAKGAVNR